MFNKRKVLYSAMAVALMSGGGSAWANGLLLCDVSGDACSTSTSAATPIIAAEDISAGTQIADTGNALKVIYIPGSTIDQDFYLKFSLSGGAEWKKTATDKMALSYAPAALDVAPATTGPSVVPDDSSTIFYYIGAKENNVKNDGAFTFSFSVYDTNAVLSSSGSSIELSVSLELAANTAKKLDTAVDQQLVTLVKSSEGQLVEVNTSGMEAAKIDVTQDSKSFTLQNKTSSTAKLGEIRFVPGIAVKTATEVSKAWTFDPTSVKGSSIIISNAPFNASLNGDLVYIDTGDGVYNVDDDYLATTVEGDQAVWELDGTTTSDLVDACAASCDIIIEADGETSVDPLSEAPTINIGIDYESGYVKQLKKKLLHIKRNGAVCTLYNVIGDGGADNVSIRITNDGTQEGIVWATLRGLDGVALFTQQPIIGTPDAIITAPLASHQTARIDGKHLVALAPDFAGKRGILTLSSNISADSMEVFGLMRNKAGGPLMNLSTGASNDGCEN